MDKTETFIYPGYMSDEAAAFFNGKLKSEVRDGIGVVGYWAQLYDGTYDMLEKGAKYEKDNKGNIQTCT